MRADTDKPAAWTPTKIQFLYRHLNSRYYVRTFAGGKEKWTNLKTTLLSVAKNRMNEHLDAAERQKSSGEAVPAMGKVTEIYRQQLQASDVRPNTQAYRDAGIKLVFKSWEGIAELNVRRITSRIVEDWLRRFKANAKPHVHWSDVDTVRGTIRLRVTKYGEERTVPMTAEMRQFVARMKAERDNAGPTSPVLLVKEAQGFINSASKKWASPGSRLMLSGIFSVRHVWKQASMSGRSSTGSVIRTTARCCSKFTVMYAMIMRPR